MKRTILASSLISLFCAIQLVMPCRATTVSAQNENRGLHVPTRASAERRVALVIGNGAYPESPLRNPVNDAQDMAKALRSLRFDVIYGENLNRKNMIETIQSFGSKLSEGGVAIFYYAGHGIQVNGSNYLIPVDATITKEGEVEFMAVDVGMVLAQLGGTGNQLNIVILDACRNNPFGRSYRSTSNNKGLAEIKAPVGTLIAYATAPGSVASDGDGRNGLYTMALLNAMKSPGKKIEEVFKDVRIVVRDQTGGKQIPWEASSLVGEFSFVESVRAANTPPPPPLKDVDRTDAQMTARAILQAYKNKDLIALANLTLDRHRAIFSELVLQGESHPRYQSIFKGWRWQAVQAWQGQIDDVRYRQVSGRDTHSSTARAKFGEADASRIIVVTMYWENGKWCFEDINSADRQDFEADSKTGSN